jgi:rRNA-processing protein CGR1
MGDIVTTLRAGNHDNNHITHVDAMSLSLTSTPTEAIPGVVIANMVADAAVAVKQTIGKRVNGRFIRQGTKTASNLVLVGKTWHMSKKPFRPTAGQTSYEKRKEQDKIKAITKAREQEMKAEKEAERDRRVQAIKDRRKTKEEKERYEKMEEKMHKKLIERRKRREKRNKLLKS